MNRTSAVFVAAVALALGCAAPPEPESDQSSSVAPVADAERAVAPLAEPESSLVPAAEASSETEPPVEIPDRFTVVMETERGMIEFELYASDAPRSVEQITALIGRNFYDGQRVIRVDEGSLIQFGDPQSRDMRREVMWGTQSSGRPIGVAEISPNRTHVVGAVALAHPGDPRQADSQLYITMVPRPELDGDYAVIGLVTSGMDVVARIERGDQIENITVAGQESASSQFQGLGR
jgi:peptidylprolyl isomerase